MVLWSSAVSERESFVGWSFASLLILNSLAHSRCNFSWKLREVLNSNISHLLFLHFLDWILENTNSTIIFCTGRIIVLRRIIWKINKLIYTIPCSCWIPIVRYASTAKVTLEKNPFLNEAFERVSMGVGGGGGWSVWRLTVKNKSFWWLTVNLSE